MNFSNKKEIYVLKREVLKTITTHQLEAFLTDFDLDKNGNLLIPFEHKGYKTIDIPTTTYMNSKVQALSFFSGSGGLDIGAQLAGVKILSSLDFFSDSVETIKSNKFFEHVEHRNEDIANVSGKDYLDLIKKNNPEKLIVIGGPPCQPFSKAGYWVTNANRKSNEDPRNMIGQYFRLIQELEPDGFILENVESLLHQSNSAALNSITDSIKKLGYNYSLLKLNSADYGVPQKRKRVFFLASKKKIDAFIEPTCGVHNKLNDNSCYESVINWIGKFDNNINGEFVSIEGKYEKELRAVPPGKNYIALSERGGHPEPKFEAGKRYWSSLLKLHPSLPSWTIIASPGHWEGPFHWNNRRLTNQEAAAIQTFPDDYKFIGSARSVRKQIGNAVPPLLAKKVVEELVRWL